MKYEDIPRATELKRQLDGVRALRNCNGKQWLMFGDFRLTTGCVSYSGDFPKNLVASPDEMHELLSAMENRLRNALADLGVAKP